MLEESKSYSQLSKVKNQIYAAIIGNSHKYTKDDIWWDENQLSCLDSSKILFLCDISRRFY